MGDNRPENGGGTPPDEGGNARYEGLPALPPEWGTIIIPDDASELDEEAEAVRRELRRTRTRSRLRLRTAAVRAALDEREQPSLGIPVAIMVVAVLTTLISLFVASWGQPAQQRPGPMTATGDAPPARPDAGTADGTGLGEIGLTDMTGGKLRLGQLLPAVIILVDECDCTKLVLEVARSVPADVTVVALGESPPAIFGAPTNVRSLAAAKDSALRTRYAAGVSPPANAATVMIVNRSADVVAVIPGAETASDVAPLDNL